MRIDVVHRLLEELGGIDEDGVPTLERGRAISMSLLSHKWLGVATVIRKGQTYVHGPATLITSGSRV